MMAATWRKPRTVFAARLRWKARTRWPNLIWAACWKKWVNWKRRGSICAWPCDWIRVTRTRITILHLCARNYPRARKRGSTGNNMWSSTRAARGASTRASASPQKPNGQQYAGLLLRGRGLRRGRQDAVQAEIDGLRAVVVVPAVAQAD